MSGYDEQYIKILWQYDEYMGEKLRTKTSKNKNKNPVAGRVIFTYGMKVIEVINLDENSLKPDMKVKVVENKLNEMVRKKVIRKDEKFDVRIDTERFPPSAFLSSTQFRSSQEYIYE